MMNSHQSDNFVFSMWQARIPDGSNELTKRPAWSDRVKNQAFASATLVAPVVFRAISLNKDKKLSFDAQTLAVTIPLILVVLSGFGIPLFDYFKPHTSTCTCLKKWQCVLLLLLASINGLSFMCTNVFLLIHINREYAWFACFLLVVPFIVVLLFYLTIRIKNTNQQPRDELFESTIKYCSDAAYISTGTAILMLAAQIFDALGVVDASALRPFRGLSLSFLASVMGALALTITAMPLELLPPDVRFKLVEVLKLFTIFPAILTVAAAMTLGAKFLGEFISLACVPILIIGLIYTALHLLGFTGKPIGSSSTEQNNLNELQPAGDIPPLLAYAIGVFTFLLSVFYAVHTGEILKNNDIIYLRLTVMTTVAVIVSSFTSIAFPSMPLRVRDLNAIFIVVETIIAFSLFAKILASHIH